MNDSVGWFDWAYKGIDHSFPGTGGPACRDFLSISQRCWESLAASIIAAAALIYAIPRLRLPCEPSCGYYNRTEPSGKRFLLPLVCLIFGIELGFKLATSRMLWIGNPCHLITMVQIFILAAPPSRIVTSTFRLHQHMLNGAPLALLFPVINTRLLPFESCVYFLQHSIMLIIPFYLLKQGEPFIPEKLLDFTWALVSFGLLLIYHFLPLQILAYVTQANLNNILCPAVPDPFKGKYYRLFAVGHQFVVILTMGKVMVLIAKGFNLLPRGTPPREAPISHVFHSSARTTKSSSNIRSTDSCCNNYDFDSGYVNCEKDQVCGGNSDDAHYNAANNCVRTDCLKTKKGGKVSEEYEKDDDEEEEEEEAEDEGGREETFECEAGCTCRSPGESTCDSHRPFVTRRLVNDRDASNDTQGQQDGHGSSEDCEPQGQGRSWSGSNRPMTVNELNTSNGHAKTH